MFCLCGFKAAGSRCLLCFMFELACIGFDTSTMCVDKVVIIMLFVSSVVVAVCREVCVFTPQQLASLRLCQRWLCTNCFLLCPNILFDSD
jgi:hypothetical protein